MDTQRPQLSFRQKFLDAAITNLWIGPLVVTFWTCTWHLLDLDLLITNDAETLVWISALIGFGSHFVASILQNILLKISTGEYFWRDNLNRNIGYGNNNTDELTNIGGDRNDHSTLNGNNIKTGNDPNGLETSGENDELINGGTTDVEMNVIQIQQNDDQRNFPGRVDRNGTVEMNDGDDNNVDEEGNETLNCCWFRQHKSKLWALWNILMSRSFTYVMAVCSVCQWRAIWLGWDYYTSQTNSNVLGTFAVSFTVMFLLRCSTQTVGPPCVMKLDTNPVTYFTATTYFGTQVGTWRHVLDSLVTVILVPFLNVTTYRGFRYFQDNVLITNDRALSGFVSLVIVYVMQVILISTREYWIRWSSWSCRKSTLLRYFVEGVHTFLNGTTAITFWRGVWILYEESQFLEDRALYWFGHVTSFCLLLASLASRTCVPTGCARDCGLPNGNNLDLPNHYYTQMQTTCAKK